MITVIHHEIWPNNPSFKIDGFTCGFLAHNQANTFIVTAIQNRPELVKKLIKEIEEARL